MDIKGAEQERRNGILAMLNNPRNWMSDDEHKELDQVLAKNKPADINVATDAWLRSKFKQTRKEFLASRRMPDSFAKQTGSTTSEQPDSSPSKKLPPNTISQEKSKIRKSEIKLLVRYPFISKTGRRITLTKLSRNFANFEESRMHRNSNCEFVNECIDYAIDQEIACFSCINCGERNNNFAI